MKMYFENWALYFTTRADARIRYGYAHETFRKKVRWQFGWADVFINMLTGGDPRESLSSSFHKDRGSVFADLVMGVLEFFVPNHGKDVVNWTVGEGGDDRELMGLGRVVIVFWLVILVAAIWYVL